MNKRLIQKRLRVAISYKDGSSQGCADIDKNLIEYLEKILLPRIKSEESVGKELAYFSVGVDEADINKHVEDVKCHKALFQDV